MPEPSSSSVRVFYPRRDRAAVVRTLRDGLPRLRASLPVRRVVLFGSYARGRHTVASDVDVLVLYRGEARSDAFALVKRAFELPGLEPHPYSEREYSAVARTIDRMTEGGVVLLDEAELASGGPTIR